MCYQMNQLAKGYKRLAKACSPFKLKGDGGGAADQGAFDHVKPQKAPAIAEKKSLVSIIGYIKCDKFGEADKIYSVTVR
jgi:hypothetical protein